MREKRPVVALTLPSPMKGEGLSGLFLTVSLFIVSLLRSSPARSQESLPHFQAGANSFSLQLGAVQPAGTNNFDTAVRSGPAFNLQFLHYSWDWIAWGAELGYAKFSRKVQNENTGILFGISNAADLGFQANDAYASFVSRINLLENRPWTPYLLGGIGVHEFDGKADWMPVGAPPNSGRKQQKAFARNLTETGAAGVEGFVLQNFSLSFEARFRSMELGSRFAPDSVDCLSYLFGFRYWFGI